MSGEGDDWPPRATPAEVVAYMTARKEDIEPYLEEQLSIGHHPEVLKAIAYYPMAGGKRLRPVLTLAVADAISEGAGWRAMPFGCALELVHNFTLVHDDLMDEDSVRRGRPTLHTVWDEASAINTGDILFALSFEVMTKTEADDATVRRLVTEASRTVFEIGEGQQWDMDFEGAEPGSVTEEDYLRMNEFKTGRLFEMASKGGARVAGADEALAQEMGLFAREMGIGFQIWDDYLDVYADQAKLGKDVGSDIRNGKHTLMAIRTLASASPEDRPVFLKAFGNADATEEEVASAIGVMERTGAVESARDTAKAYAARAEERLRLLHPSEHREFLRGLIYYMIARDY
ncbi:MAG: polyprenyl synthetase family protein [Thermoplasmata archaeon]|nr:MAG: polyprenyl synthetase family protein [Thermoplasmata archaeon]